MGERPKMRSYHDLVVWQRSVDLVVAVYGVTRGFPSSEKYGLVSQIQRAAVSIPSNVAEGQARNTPAAFANHIDIALGSAAELETQLLIALKLGYLEQPAYDKLIAELTEINRMLYGLLRCLRPRKSR